MYVNDALLGPTTPTYHGVNCKAAVEIEYFGHSPSHSLTLNVSFNPELVIANILNQSWHSPQSCNIISLVDLLPSFT